MTTLSETPTTLELISEIKKLSENQKEDLLRHIKLYYCPDDTCSDNRSEIYKIYSSTIADLMAKVEVYTNTVPYDVMDSIEMFWHLMTATELVTPSDSPDELYEATRKLAVHIINELRYILLRRYIQMLTSYNRTLRDFNWTGVKNDNGTPILKEVKPCIKKLKNLKKQGEKILRTHSESIEYNELLDAGINYKKVTNVEAFEEAIALAENVIGECEKYYPEIVDNGYRHTIWKRVWKTFLLILSFALTAYGVFLILKETGIL